VLALVAVLHTVVAPVLGGSAGTEGLQTRGNRRHFRWGEVLEGEGEKPFNFRLAGQIFFVKKTRGNTRCPRGGRANLRGGQNKI
jgi:hypothetical protein